MKFPPIKTYASVGLIAAGAILTGCASDEDTTTTPNPGSTASSVAKYHELKGDFSESITLDASNVYKITGKVNILSGATLTIPAGTTLYGSTGQSYLAINAGAKIEAKGTQANPIVFTSAADYNNASTDDAKGEWGGLVLIGKAPIIGGTETYEAGDQVGGGTDAADNSGTLQYVAIKHTGYKVENDKELNGLSLLAVGSGTTIENVAVIGSSDDGIELWGGTVNLTGVYVYNAADDSLDTDLGYTGTIKDAYAVQYLVDATNYDSSGIETGNDDDSYTSVGGTSGVIGQAVLTDNTQATMATYKNVTVEAIGGAIYLKNDAGGIFDNVSVTSIAPPAGTSQTATAGQAIVTHRTTDTVDDLSGTPYGIQILAGGLELINSVVATDIYAAETAKGSSKGGCDPLDAGTDGAPNCTGYTQAYWEAIPDVTTVDTDHLFYSDVAGVTGATIANIWKGKAGTNDK